jgi:hypothetical protein
MLQNKAFTDGGTVHLHCVDENPLKAESNNINKTGDNQESDCKCGTTGSKK